jgi:hypothetical protein
VVVFCSVIAIWILGRHPADAISERPVTVRCDGEVSVGVDAGLTSVVVTVIGVWIKIGILIVIIISSSTTITRLSRGS